MLILHKVRLFMRSILINKKIKASISIVVLMILLSLLTILFLSFDKIVSHKEQQQLSYKTYLQDKFKILDELDRDFEKECNVRKKEKNIIVKGSVGLHFSCRFTSVFKQDLNNKKYVSFKNIEDHFDIDNFQILVIDNLDDLPKTSTRNPQIVYANKPLVGRLKRNFYGIIITDSLFEITGKKLYGKLYSSYENNGKSRYISYKKSVIKYVHKKYRNWHYLENSKNMIKGSF